MNYTVVGLYEYNDVYQVVSDDGTVIFQGRKRTCEKLGEVENKTIIPMLTELVVETSDED